MGLEFINRIIRTSLIISALAFLFVAVYRNFSFGLGLFLGTAWGCLNLFFITQTIVEAFSLKKPDKKKLILILLVKFPLLYSAGYILLRLKYFPVESLLIGFTLIFFITFLKALGQVVLSSFSGEEKKISTLNMDSINTTDKNLR
jgi:biotin transporter BioY